MKLNNIRIKNFCSFGNKGIDIKMNQTFNLIVGPNDTGKVIFLEHLHLHLRFYLKIQIILIMS